MQYDLDPISDAASHLLAASGQEKLWCFVGEMGAGKTTLIKEICKQLNVSNELSSPTFSIINTYETDAHEELYHFDFYRIEDPNELIQIGVEEYFDSGNYCFVEWPDRAIDFLPDHYLKISIKLVADNRRELKITHV